MFGSPLPKPTHHFDHSSQKKSLNNAVTDQVMFGSGLPSAMQLSVRGSFFGTWIFFNEKDNFYFLSLCLVRDMGSLNHGVDGFDDDHMHKYQLYDDDNDDDEDCDDEDEDEVEDDDDNDDDEDDYIHRLRVGVLGDMGAPVHPWKGFTSGT